MNLAVLTSFNVLELVDNNMQTMDINKITKVWLLRSHLEIKCCEDRDMPTIEKYILSHFSKARKKIMETKE